MTRIIRYDDFYPKHTYLKCLAYFILLLPMKISILIIQLLFSFFCFSQNSYPTLELSKENSEDVYYITKEEKIFFQLISDKHQKKGIITNIQKDSVQIDNAYYIKYSDIKSLISQKERKFLTKKHWQILFAGSITTIGSIFLINSQGYQINEIAGIIGISIGIPVFIKGIHFFIIKRTILMDKWTITAKTLPVQ